MARISAMNVVHERQRSAAHAAQRVPPEQARDDDADELVPIKKLEGITGREVNGVGPRAPAEYAADHKNQRGCVRFGLVHAPRFLPVAGISSSTTVAIREPKKPCHHARKARA